ncbi:hypothetical protein K0C01_02140 [Salinarchaeum sp. IM2453]|nr:hypothetical protein [Salinarchaeum sp. IM2453]QZA88986.1 hypothetical protein K0C01_02140 [Salinarchaeum sp. IM2453]
MSSNNERERESSVDIMFRFGMLFAVIIGLAALGFGVYHLMVIAGWI